MSKDFNILDFENRIDELDEQTKVAFAQAIDMNKKSKVLKVHPYKITQLNGKDTRWHTYVKVDGKYKEIRKATEKEIIDELCRFYGISGISFERLFWEWLDYKSTITESPATIRRHEQHYRKYLQGSKLNEMDIDKITKITLQSECNQIVKKFNLSKKEWMNLKTILNGMFEYAVDMEYRKDNPMDRLKISVLYKQKEIKSAESQIYTDEEYSAIIEYLEDMYSKDNDSVFLEAEFQFYTGVRVGELVALEWSDVDFEKKTLTIQRQEANIPYQENGKWKDHREIVEHTKTNNPRRIQLLPEAIGVLEKLNPNHADMGDEFIFVRNGERISERAVNYVLEKYAERNGKRVRSSHKSRKNYASRLIAGGVSIKVVSLDLGHNNLLTTEGYIYANEPGEEEYRAKDLALAPNLKKTACC